MKLYKNKENIILIVCMIICIAMGINWIKEGHTFNVIKWVIILGMTIILFFRKRKFKK